MIVLHVVVGPSVVGGPGGGGGRSNGGGRRGRARRLPLRPGRDAVRAHHLRARVRYLLARRKRASATFLMHSLVAEGLAIERRKRLHVLASRAGEALLVIGVA